MRTHVICLLLLLAALAVSSSGCLAVAVGAGAAGTVAYLAGDLDVVEPYDIDTVYTAARKALDELGVHIIEGQTTQDALSATITARDAADKQVLVKLKSTTSETTKISVRIGTFGDEAKSQLIYDKIKEHLKAAS